MRLAETAIRDPIANAAGSILAPMMDPKNETSGSPVVSCLKGDSMRRLMILAITFLLSFGAALAADVPQAGQAAPAVTLPSQDGTPVSLKGFSGKWVVLYFYPKDMTQGCTIEAHNFQRDLAKYDQANAVILGVSVDSVDSHKQFCAKDSLTFKLLADTDKKVVDSYGSLRPNGMAARNTFLVDPTGKIAKVWTGVNPNAHSEEVLAALSNMK
jgi:thioredoxin-dependent peroxiredoxin